MREHSNLKNVIANSILISKCTILWVPNKKSQEYLSPVTKTYSICWLTLTQEKPTRKGTEIIYSFP
jgi:hypothetical protein